MRRIAPIGSILLLASLLACASSVDRQLISSRVVLDQVGITLDLKKALPTPGHFNFLCIRIPDGYQEDSSSWTITSPKGEAIILEATMVTAEGGEDPYVSRSFLHSTNKKYICLSSPSQRFNPHRTYQQVTIKANLPISIDEIRWLSNDDM